MHGPVDGEVSRSSRISPSIAPTLSRRMGPDRPLRYDFRVRLRVEPDEQRPTDPKRRRPEPAGRPEQKLEQLGLRRPGHGEVHADGLLAPGDPDLVDVLRHAERGLAGDRRLPRVHLLDDADLPLRKKLLRAGAGSSALAVIAPIHPGHW